jgi:hypothetical protein
MRKTAAGFALAVIWPLGISGCAAILGIEEQTFDGGDGSDSGAGTEAAANLGPDGHADSNVQPHEDAANTIDGTMAMHDAEDARHVRADSPSLHCRIRAGADLPIQALPKRARLPRRPLTAVVHPVQRFLSQPTPAASPRWAATGTSIRRAPSASS